jgi:hypothetical protein
VKKYSLDFLSQNKVESTWKPKGANRNFHIMKLKLAKLPFPSLCENECRENFLLSIAWHCLKFEVNQNIGQSP